MWSSAIAATSAWHRHPLAGVISGSWPCRLPKSGQRHLGASAVAPSAEPRPVSRRPAALYGEPQAHPTAGGPPCSACSSWCFGRSGCGCSMAKPPDNLIAGRQHRDRAAAANVWLIHGDPLDKKFTMTQAAKPPARSPASPSRPVPHPGRPYCNPADGRDVAAG